MNPYQVGDKFVAIEDLDKYRDKFVKTVDEIHEYVDAPTEYVHQAGLGRLNLEHYNVEDMIPYSPEIQEAFETANKSVNEHWDKIGLSKMN